MRRRNKRLDQLRAMFARMKGERSARDIGKVALGAGALGAAAYGVYKVGPRRIRWGRVGMLGAGLGGAYVAAPYARDYFSKENRTIRKMKRSMKDQTKMLKKAAAYHRRQSEDLSELDPETRKALFLAQTGNFLDTTGTRKYSKREFMLAMLKAHQYEQMERRLASMMGKPLPGTIKPAEQMTRAEQEEAVERVFKGREINPTTGIPVAESSTAEMWNLRRSHEGSADLLKNRPRETETSDVASYADIEESDDEPRKKKKRKRYSGEVTRDWAD